MMTGTVEGRHAYVGASVYGPNEQETEIEFVLDTGFTAQITFSHRVCEALGLTYLRTQPADLADGITVMLEVCEDTLLWHDIERNVEALSMEGAPLIGMSLLDGFEVCLLVRDGGLVRIKAF